MGYQVKVIEDSVTPAGARLTTMQVTYPRFLLPEMNTHRAFSRSYASNRAIPIRKVIEGIAADPFIPEFVGKNQPGMQANEELTGEAREEFERLWLKGMQSAVDTALKMIDTGAAKQTVNRILEPYQWTTGIITSTEWDNFFGLRCHLDAQPEIRTIAEMMYEALKKSTPKICVVDLEDDYDGDITVDNMHTPYVSMEERKEIAYTRGKLELLKVSAARCCRVSYLKHDQTKPSVEEDMKLFERLVTSNPIHASPLEHVAVPLEFRHKSSRNFMGWTQFREYYERCERRE